MELGDKKKTQLQFNNSRSINSLIMNSCNSPVLRKGVYVLKLEESNNSAQKVLTNHVHWFYKNVYNITIQCEILGSQGDEYVVQSVLGCSAV
jgi:hypothetical protein